MKTFLRKLKIPLICILLLLTLSFLPLSLEILLLINLSVLIFIGVSRIRLARYSYQTPVHLLCKHKPKVSIHIPICNEPSGLVKQTIAHALKQTYENFEIIVLSNNTSDVKVWKPIETYCEHLDKRVRFVNIKSLQGFKAGALNLCRKLTSPDAKYIFTIDADYKLSKNALEIAVSAIENHGVALVQFPQSYYNKSRHNERLSLNFNYYFDLFAKGSNSYFSVLPTGTLSLIRIKALDHIGGWSAQSITEDAELGTRLIEKGFNTMFCNRIIGRGLIPSNLNDLVIQRSRWIYGNMQTLVNSLFNRKYSLKTKWYTTLQLTAWFNFLGVPFAALIFTTILQFVNPDFYTGWIVPLSFYSIVAHLFLHFVTLFYGYRKDLRKTIKGYSAHLANLDLGAFVWWEYLLTKSKPFKRTNKFYSRIQVSMKDVLLSLILMICGIVLFIQEENLFSAGLIGFGSFIFIAKALLIIELENTIIPKTKTKSLTPKFRKFY